MTQYLVIFFICLVDIGISIYTYAKTKDRLSFWFIWLSLVLAILNMCCYILL